MQEALPHTADQDAKKPMLFAMVMILAGLSLLKKKSETK
ncbi:LPXTG cell wall anchor domain-containing protein [Streptococcus iniae]